MAGLEFTVAAALPLVVILAGVKNHMVLNIELIIFLNNITYNSE